MNRIGALATLARVAAALAAGVEREDRWQLVRLQRMALEVLAQGDRRPATAALCERIAQLERQLADRDRGTRARIICERLGLPRSTYYRLRASLSSK